MSIAYIGESQAKPGQAAKLRDFMLAVVAPAVRASHGCESCTIVQSETDSSRFTVVEIWASVDAHRASVKNISPENIATFMQLVAMPPRGGYHRVL
jgi:quinol monooxygenase YgiN